MSHAETTGKAAPVSEPQQDRVIIFDTTLRDGEQSPGASMNLEQKLQVASALRELGVDVIEAGFAAASPGDLEAIQAVSRQIDGPIIASLSRSNKGDIAASWEALKEAPRKRCHVFLATSPIHRDFKLKLAKVPFALIVGEKEVEARGVAPRRHGGADLKTMPLDQFVELMKKEATPPY